MGRPLFRVVQKPPIQDRADIAFTAGLAWQIFARNVAVDPGQEAPRGDDLDFIAKIVGAWTCQQPKVLHGTSIRSFACGNNQARDLFDVSGGQ
jgi:hypothetical protein